MWRSASFRQDLHPCDRRCQTITHNEIIQSSWCSRLEARSKLELAVYNASPGFGQKAALPEPVGRHVEVGSQYPWQPVPLSIFSYCLEQVEIPLGQTLSLTET